MNISLEKVGNVSAVITVNMVKADYEDNVKKALKSFSHKAQVPGFRPGKVPVSLVKKMYGTQAKVEEVNKLLGEKLFAYIEENKLNMLGEPMPNANQQPQDIENADDFEFKFDIALAPEFTATLSADDHVTYYDIEVSDEQVANQAKELAQRAGNSVDVDKYEDRDILRGVLAQLDENGQPLEGGLVVEKVSLMPTFFKNDDQKNIFAAAALNDVITFNPSVAYEGSDAELAALLKVSKEDAANYKGNFSFQVEQISRFVPAEMNQELFDSVFGEGTVENEEGFRAKIKEGIAAQNVAQSDFRFLIDVRAYMENKVGELEFPVELLKKFMIAKNTEKGEKFVEDNFDKSIAELKWHLIKEQLVSANGIKIEDKDVKATAIQAARFQFAQYGMNNIPEEYLEQYATELLKDKNQVNGFIERAIDNKLSIALKEVVTLEHKGISTEDFGKLFD